MSEAGLQEKPIPKKKKLGRGKRLAQVVQMRHQLPNPFSIKDIAMMTGCDYSSAASVIQQMLNLSLATDSGNRGRHRIFTLATSFADPAPSQADTPGDSIPDPKMDVLQGTIMSGKISEIRGRIDADVERLVVGTFTEGKVAWSTPSGAKVTIEWRNENG